VAHLGPIARRSGCRLKGVEPTLPSRRRTLWQPLDLVVVFRPLHHHRRRIGSEVDNGAGLGIAQRAPELNDSLTVRRNR
jgi:hypothetical protein